MKTIKALFMLFCITIVFSEVSIAQVYSNETIYYISGSGDYISIWEFNGRQALYKQCNSIPYERKEYVKDVLKKQPDAFDNLKFGSSLKVRGDHWTHTCQVNQADYCPNIPTNNRFVYRIKNNVDNSYYDYYCAVSNDLSSIIIWRETNGEINNKKIFTRIPKEDLLPQAANYDFLNE